MKLGTRHCIAAILLVVAVAPITLRATESATAPAGRWRTVDDKTGRDRSVIRIEIADGVLSGRIEQSLDPNDPPNAKCTKCTGPRKDQPLHGMTILTGLHADGDERHWSGGEIVDPDSGNVYRVKVTVAADGHTLEIRGYIGISLFGRSQTWTRMP